MTPQPRDAAAIAEAALCSVFGREAVSALREDSPLSAVGILPADLVCVSDTVAEHAQQRGLTCVLDDAALEGLTTVGDLVRAIETGIRGASPDGSETKETA